MALDEKAVRHVSLLSRLALNEDEIHLYTGQLSKILTYIEKLNELDTTDVDPMITAAAGGNVFREDIPREGLDRTSALQSAPDHDDEYFRVPPVIE